jgi:RNA polymerase sigma-70 factor (ECF subfamily)
VADDATLLRRACRGDESAFCQLFARHQRQIYQYACRMCGPAAADDIVQETFLAVLNGARFDSSKGSVAGYLFGIARHHVLKLVPLQSGTLIQQGDAERVDAAAGEATPFETLAREETIAAVREAIEALPPLYREAIALCDLQELDYETAAQVVGCPIGTVRSRLHRARAVLAARLKADVPRRAYHRHHG